MPLPLTHIFCEIAMRNTCALLGIDHKNNILKPSYINNLRQCENVSHATNHYCTAGGVITDFASNKMFVFLERLYNFFVFTQIYMKCAMCSKYTS
jgi:hypothetical protein